MPNVGLSSKQENGPAKNATGIVRIALSLWKLTLRVANSEVGQQCLRMSCLTFFVSIVRERLKRQELRKRKMAGRPLKKPEGRRGRLSGVERERQYSTNPSPSTN